MAHPILINGVPHRLRRGRLVPIPPEWLGKVTSRQTIAKRASKQPPAERKAPKQTRKALAEREDKR